MRLKLAPSPVERDNGAARMVHLVDPEVSLDVALCGKRLTGPMMPHADAECIVCADLERRR